MQQRQAAREHRNKEIVEWVESLVWAAVVLLLLLTFGVRVVRVQGDSMYPTLLDTERLLISSLPYRPAHGDIVVADQYTRYGKVLIKRVIGCPGDTIDIDFEEGVVYRNGEALDEPYTAAPTYLAEGTALPLTVPDGCVFLMGDNRNGSLDSRSPDVGLVDARDVIGRVLLRLTPFPRAGGIA